MKVRAKSPSQRGTRNQLRIIAGQWRGRRLTFPDVAGLRPTGDRIRETLFNWLAPHIVGSRCLDAFAGSGALGFESLSRGAREAVMIERDASAIAQLAASKALLGASGATIIQADTLAWLRSQASGPPFDLVFLDPPFAGNLLQPAVDGLANGALLAPGALIYIETAAEAPLTIPDDWQTLREKTTGGISCRLLVRN
ncbi:MAG: 16S rRNA (guanine(966)-N(2))-methyltransferase RsmD [Pseudomonadota bacterium]|nr:16S rRNA (guanine(966)-N(2))-methyltransferase RsmD [Pseudomonadota bacterium]